MKKTLLTAALLTAFGVAVVAPKAASAADGTINFTGAVTSTTCTIKVNGTSGTTTVTLPTVQASDFTAAGTTTGFVPLNITLSGCTPTTGTGAAVEARPYFEPATLDTTASYTNYLKNTASSSAATGVDIMISTTNSGTSGAVLLSQGEGAQGVNPASITSGSATFGLYAAYVSNTASVTAGAVAATVNYDIDYK